MTEKKEADLRESRKQIAEKMVAKREACYRAEVESWKRSITWELESSLQKIKSAKNTSEINGVISGALAFWKNFLS